MVDNDPKKAICVACACDILATLRDAAISCEMAPLSTLLQNALDEAMKMRGDGDGSDCNCGNGTDVLVDSLMQKREAMQLLEFVSAIAMLDDDGRAELASELETAQINNLLDKIH